VRRPSCNLLVVCQITNSLPHRTRAGTGGPSGDGPDLAGDTAAFWFPGQRVGLESRQRGVPNRDGAGRLKSWRTIRHTNIKPDRSFGRPISRGRTATTEQRESVETRPQAGRNRRALPQETNAWLFAASLWTSRPRGGCESNALVNPIWKRPAPMGQNPRRESSATAEAARFGGR
jgi:hypothetical protein